MAGVGPKDIDVAEMYENFTAMVLLQARGLGFCAVGESGAFVEAGHTAGRMAPPRQHPYGGNLSELTSWD